MLLSEYVKLFGEDWKAQTDELKKHFSAAITDIRLPETYQTDVPIIYVNRESVLDVLTYLKTKFTYNFLSDITATDESTHPRFEVVYNLFSTSKHFRIRVKVKVGENEEIPSAVGIWPGANWAEREVWDMYGIKFSNHPNLKRILMHNNWQGHPLRKDYPINHRQFYDETQPIDSSRFVNPPALDPEGAQQ